MANTKQAKKRTIQSAKKHLRNKSIISQHRTELKKIVAMLQPHAKDPIDTNSDAFKSQLRLVVRLTDSAVNKGVYHRNKAARIKSRLFTRIHTYTNAHKSPVSSATVPEHASESTAPASSDVDTPDITQS